ncbi:MAG TPA: DUF2723 domain-containing protein, partial [Polyangiales bacterium]|nr:DUF2723 domain-containing protein [Polyangiales bacterium]
MRLRSALLTAIWASTTLLLAWHAHADVSLGDSGEIGGAALSLGVAHPTGFPLDMLLLRAFGLLPIGSLAWRENLGVASIGAAAVTGIAALTFRLAERVRFSSASATIGALFAASGLIAFQTFLESALSVEVYSTALLLVILAALISLDRRRASAIYPVFGLSLGAHV